MKLRLFHHGLVCLGFLAAASPVALAASRSQLMSESAQCKDYLSWKIPRFRVARKDISEDGSAVVLYISIAPSYIDREDLITLGCALGRQYADRDSLRVHIMDSYRAAKRFNPQGEGNDRQTNLSNRASYGFGRDTHGGTSGQYLDWRPSADEPGWNHIDLGPSPVRGTGG
jgi:hypothetical protein